ncbi:tripartite tricarboxylate transporter substrate binding protein [Pigmentiphaga soli]|uniref:Tripartite tricarboxylate transporter substrate binding protein n=1 Tax=Pigmentiphaga soli TaxID=1007095 RepID=A0ABP8HA60_9BURK
MNALRLIALCCIAALSAAAQAQYPSRPVRIVVGFPAGGPIDVQARIIGQKLSERLGQPVIVDNRPGADGIIATQAVARADPDGHTLLLASIGFATVPALHANLPYDPGKDFAPIIYAASGPMVLVGGPSMPAKDLAGLLELARSKPGAINYGSVGIGSSNHLGVELLARRAGVKMHHVPYKGASPATTDLIAGRLDLMLNPVNNALPEIRNGRLRPFAVSTRHRAPTMPDVPAIAETVPDYDVALWSGFFAPAGTPAGVVGLLNREIGQVLKAPDLQQTLRAQGFEVVGGSSQAFGAFARDELQRWAALVAAEGIKLE